MLVAVERQAATAGGAQAHVRVAAPRLTLVDAPAVNAVEGGACRQQAAGWNGSSCLQAAGSGRVRVLASGGPTAHPGDARPVRQPSLEEPADAVDEAEEKAEAEPPAEARAEALARVVAAVAAPAAQHSARARSRRAEEARAALEAGSIVKDRVWTKAEAGALLALTRPLKSSAWRMGVRSGPRPIGGQCGSSSERLLLNAACLTARMDTAARTPCRRRLQGYSCPACQYRFPLGASGCLVYEEVLRTEEKQRSTRRRRRPALSATGGGRKMGGRLARAPLAVHASGQ
mgnify:CR=1 FL=1